jgi:hypothetical protein
MTKFAYKDKVKVTGGFYRGQVGEIDDFRTAKVGLPFFKKLLIQYEVRIPRPDGATHSLYVSEYFLELA